MFRPLRGISPARTSARTAHGSELLHATEAPRIEAIARALEISTRQLERLFRRDIGLAPKSYACLLRFRRVLAALACLLPSLRASRIDPLVALRAE